MTCWQASRPNARYSLFLAGLTLGLLAPLSHADQGLGIREKPYSEVIQQVVGMPSDGDLQRRAQRHGFNIVNVMWEDTGRAGGSSVGPNISDLTLQVREDLGNQGWRTHLLPVIRYPNFEDKTGDIPVDKLWIRVGNQQKGGKPIAVPLKEVLSNLKVYLSHADTLKGKGNFMAGKDSHFLVSAQHVFLPIPKSGKAHFNPVLFNYQSAPGNPAVLTLLATREGTSATVIDNRGGDQSSEGWGQQLFYNNAGQKTVFTAERKSDVKARIESGHAKPSDEGALEEGADMMMIIQVPLKHESRGYMVGMAVGTAADMMPSMVPAAAPMAEKSMARGRSDVEQAVLGHGDDLGPFDEMQNYKLDRDPRFPIRITVQFYKATSNGVVSDQDLVDVADSIGKVYKSADYVGSLVVPEGQRNRPTDWIKDDPKVAEEWRPFKRVRDFFGR